MANDRDAIQYVEQAAQHYNINAELAIKVCLTESRCSCSVKRGAAGEIGPMQVLPRTARGIKASLDGCKNQVFAGVKYLKLALDAGGLYMYNQGIGNRKSKKGAAYERAVYRQDL